MLDFCYNFVSTVQSCITYFLSGVIEIRPKMTPNKNHKGKKKRSNISAIFSHDLSLILSFAIKEQAVNYESHWEEKRR